MSYLFYLGNTLLPITPDKLSIKIKNQNKTLNLISEGEINILKDAGLTEISFEAMIPSQEYTFATYKNGFAKADEFLKAFSTLKANKQPFQFIVTRTKPNGEILHSTNMTVSLESYDISESNKEGYDCKVSFKLKQYKTYGTKKVVMINGVAVVQDTTQVKTPTTEMTYKVASGDSLMSISKKVYGDSSKYKSIYKKNAVVIDDANSGGLQKYSIREGLMLTILV